MKRLLDYDPFTGVTQYFHYDDMSGDWGIESVQDVEPIIDTNKAMQNDDNYSRDGIKNEFWHVARIPVTIQEKWLREDGIDIYNKDHWPKVKRKLNDPDYRYLKTTTGTV
jgi:hypothetical protein